VRSTNSPASRRGKKRVLKRAKGFVGGRHRLYRTAVETVMRAQAYAFRDRRARKREFRKLWIIRINAACRQRGVNYSRFICALEKAGVSIDRKELAELAVSDPAAFDKLAQMAKA